MPTIHFERMRDRLSEFQFQRLFIDELGWSQPVSRQPVQLPVKDTEFTLRHIAELGGVAVLEVTTADGQVPDAKVRASLHSEVAKQYHENLLIFVDAVRSQ